MEESSDAVRDPEKTAPHEVETEKEEDTIASSGKEWRREQEPRGLSSLWETRNTPETEEIARACSAPIEGRIEQEQRTLPSLLESPEIPVVEGTTSARARDVQPKRFRYVS